MFIYTTLTKAFTALNVRTGLKEWMITGTTNDFSFLVKGTWYQVQGTGNFAPGTKYLVHLWILSLLTWYLICMTLSSLQVSISEGGWEHCLSAPPFKWAINTWLLRQFPMPLQLNIWGDKLRILPSHMPSILDYWGNKLPILPSHMPSILEATNCYYRPISHHYLRQWSW